MPTFKKIGDEIKLNKLPERKLRKISLRERKILGQDFASYK